MSHINGEVRGDSGVSSTHAFTVTGLINVGRIHCAFMITYFWEYVEPNMCTVFYSMFHP